jgi:hypothetical protein
MSFSGRVVRKLTWISPRIHYTWYCAGLFLIVATSVMPRSVAAEEPTPSPAEQKLQAVVADLKQRLALRAPVVVSIVPTNALMMSVEAPDEESNPFKLATDAAFLQALTDDELEAAIAHELGHVWVFTHHPYLQTEELANQIAMRVVSRKSLERVYEKVWKHGGTKGDLAQFLGPAPHAAGLTGETQPR